MNPLKGMHRWVSLPSIWAGLIGVGLAVLYAAFTAEIREGTRVQFAVILGVVVVVANLMGDSYEQSRLRTLKALGFGLEKPTRDNLSKALGEASRIPDTVFWASLAFWVVSSFSVGVIYSILPGVGWAEGSRLAFIGLALAPLVSVLAHLSVLRRARAVMSRIIAQGVATNDLVRALPADRNQLQRRVVLFVAVSAFTPLVLLCDLVARWGFELLATMLKTDEAAQPQLLAQAPSDGLMPLVIITGMTMVVVVACGWLGGLSLGEPLRAITAATQRIARGQLGKSTIVPAEDELWGVAAAFASMEHQLITALRQLKDAGSKISSTTEELISSSLKHESGAADQTGALSQTSATTEELARSAKQIAQNASDVSRLAQAMLDSAQHGKRSAGAFYASILRVREGNQAIADSVVRLNKRVQQVGRIVEFIDGIADKSDLLALNAELEGTKAGDVGRGFSLVAAEMRRLSESVMSSTREINRLIEEIRDATNAAVMATEAGVKATDAGSGLARQVTESLDRIVDFANQTTDAVKAITLATHQQQSGTDQLAAAMSDILRSTQSALGATAQMSSANTDLSNLSGELQKTVSRFEVSS
ncbi:MAG: methyl-accepting chemotaxis protein [Myxococcaceae bacterium]|nr:methyl-accepting chemotaxis protein [Myxococcaceae bacterium]